MLVTTVEFFHNLILQMNTSMEFNTLFIYSINSMFYETNNSLARSQKATKPETL